MNIEKLGSDIKITLADKSLTFGTKSKDVEYYLKICDNCEDAIKQATIDCRNAITFNFPEASKESISKAVRAVMRPASVHLKRCAK